MIAEYSLNGLGLAFSQKPVIDENTVKPLTYGLVKKDRHHRGVHAAAQSADYVIVADFLANRADGRFHEGFHGPGRAAPADAEQKILQNVLAAGRVRHFRMKLHPVEMTVRVAHRSGRRIIAMSHGPQKEAELEDPVAVTHPDPNPLFFNSVENITRRVYIYRGGAVFAPLRLLMAPASWLLSTIPASRNDRVDCEDGVQVVRLPSFTAPESSLLLRLRESWSFGRHVCRYLEQELADVGFDHANVWPLFSQALIARYCAERGVPLILHIEDIYPEVSDAQTAAFLPVGCGLFSHGPRPMDRPTCGPSRLW